MWHFPGFSRKSKQSAIQAGERGSLTAMLERPRLAWGGKECNHSNRMLLYGDSVIYRVLVLHRLLAWCLEHSKIEGRRADAVLLQLFHAVTRTGQARYTARHEEQEPIPMLDTMVGATPGCGPRASPSRNRFY